MQDVLPQEGPLEVQNSEGNHSILIFVTEDCRELQKEIVGGWTVKLPTAPMKKSSFRRANSIRVAGLSSARSTSQWTDQLGKLVQGKYLSFMAFDGHIEGSDGY